MASYYQESVNLVGQGDPERLEGTGTDADLLPMLGVQPLLGRFFTTADDQDGAPGTLILSYRLWQSVFGGDTNILGRKVILNDEPYTVIGVMPHSFNFPDRESEFWIPNRFPPSMYEDRANNFVQVLARLKPGVTIEHARAELALIAAQLEHQYPKENEKTTSNVLRLRDELSDQSRSCCSPYVAPLCAFC